MMTCQDNELQLLMRARGVLEADAVSALESHLPQCTSCSTFAATQDDLENLMDTPQTSPDWDALSLDLSQRLSAERRSSRLKVLALIVSVALALIQPSFYLVAAAALFVFAWSLQQGRVNLEEVSRVDLLQGLREQLDRQIGRARRGPWLLLASVGFFLAPALTGNLVGSAAIVLVFACLLLLLMAAWQLLVLLPRLQAERAELG